MQSTVIIDAYKALFLSYLNYCIVLYGSSHAYILDKLQVAQNNAIRAMFGYTRDTNVKQTLVKHKLLTVKYNYIYELGIFAYKNFKNLFEREMCYYFDPNNNQNRYSQPLRIPITRLNYRFKSTDLAMARLWNNTGENLRGCPTLGIFKIRWFNHIFENQLREQ